MKRALLLLFILGFSLTLAAQRRGTSGYSGRSGSGTTVRVRPHVTRQGTYRPPHARTAPNNSRHDNWSTKGNVNPMTGKKGTVDPAKPTVRRR